MSRQLDLAQAVADSLSRPATFQGRHFCIHPGETAQETAARHDPQHTPGTGPRRRDCDTVDGYAQDYEAAIEPGSWTWDSARYCPACGRTGKWILQASKLELHKTSALRFLESLRPAQQEFAL